MDTPKNLYEDESYQSQCLEQFREWIEKDSKIKKCRTDDEFLLRFLRYKKFFLPRAFGLLVEYLTTRKSFPHLFENIDPNDPDIDRLISDGFITIFPQYDAHGSPVVIYKFDCIDAKRDLPTLSARIVNLAFEIYSCDPRSQTIGTTIIVDCTAVTSEMIGRLPVSFIKDCTLCWQNTFPCRPRAAYLINMSTFTKTVFSIMKPFLKEKIRNVVHAVSEWEVVEQELGLSLLPKELGGTMSRVEQVKNTKIKAQELREEILAISDFDIEIDHKGTRFESVKDSELDAEIVGSFRKLEVD